MTAGIITGGGVGRSELDSHADTSCLGQDWIVDSYTGETCTVFAYDNSYKPKSIKIVNGYTAYDHHDGTTFIIWINQALHMPTLEHSLIFPNQMRNHGIEVHDCPRSLAPADAPSIHSIIVDEFDLIIPLKMLGIISYFPTRLPSGREI